jgi:hypothetical protein
MSNNPNQELLSQNFEKISKKNSFAETDKSEVHFL